MGLMDKLKAGAEQAKELAGEAASRAKEEARDLQLKRELGQAYDDLGKAAFELVDQGALTHADLEPHVSKIRELKEKLAKDDGGDEAAETGAEAGEAKDPPSA